MDTPYFGMFLGFMATRNQDEKSELEKKRDMGCSTQKDTKIHCASTVHQNLPINKVSVKWFCFI